MTQKYRGAHSACWALRHGRPEEVGWTLFKLDRGVDSGAILKQGKIVVQRGDTFRTLAWKGMRCIAEAMVEYCWTREEERPVGERPANVSAKTLYHNPGMKDYMAYLWTTHRHIWPALRARERGGVDA